MPVMPFGPPGDLLPVEQDKADDFAECQRDDGEIIAAQPQHREAQQHAPEGGENARQRQAGPERQAEGCRQQRVGIGADRIERDIAEIEQAGETHDDVQTPSEHDVCQHEDAEIEDVALIVKDHRHQQGEDKQRRSEETAGRIESALGGFRNERDAF